jgi:PAS domain S-box-containing protein
MTHKPLSMQPHPLSQNLPTSLRSPVVALGVYLSVVGVLVLAGWLLRIQRLTDWTNEGISMFPNTAVCAVLMGICVIAAIWGSSGINRFIVRISALAVATIGGLTFFEHLSGLDLHIDTLITTPTFGYRAAMSPMRMGPPASLSYLMLGMAMWLVTGGAAARKVASIIAIVTSFIALLSLTGYFFGADQLFGVARYTGIAFATTTVIMAASCAAMLLTSEFGIVAVLRHNDAGGALARRLFLPLIVLPLLLGWARRQGEQFEYYNTEFGAALQTIVEIACFIALLVWTARSIRLYQNAAQNAQWRLAAIVGSSSDAIISKSLHGVIESWNAGAERLFGYKASEAVGKHISLIIPPDRICEEDEIIQRIRRGELIDHFETVRLRKDGSAREISLTISPIRNAQGEVIGASKISRDITDRKQAEAARRASEERLRAVVEATPECVTIVRPDGSLEYMNRAGLELIEAESIEDVRDTCVFDLIADHHRDEWIERHRRVCAGERVDWEFELIDRNGTRRWMETHAVPIQLEHSGIGQMAVTREISSRKEFEQEREELLKSERAARSEAERASQLKDDFLATLSHELRTPLNAVLGWSQILRRTSQPEDLEQGLEVIERNARLQAQLIDDLLDMSRIMSGKVVLEVQPTELVIVVSAALDSVRPAATAKDIRVRTFFDPDGGLVLGDATRLQQVVWNLLTNAIKFTPQGGHVDIIVRQIDSQIELTVRDTGIGIDPEFLPSIFERFRQMDSSTTRRFGGLGLGLSIVKHLVELHGGAIRAESAGTGKGAAFVVALPMAPKSRTDKLEELSRHFNSEVTSQKLAGLRVLVVDDELDARNLVQRMLSDYGAKVTLASSAAEGLEKLRADGPSIILSDIGMPDMDGYQFIRRVRELPPHEGGETPAVALTAFARLEDRHRAMAAGFQDHICKPIRPQELILKIANVHSQARQIAIAPLSSQDTSL